MPNEEPFNPMMNSVLYHSKGASRRALEQADLLPREDDKQDAKRIYRVSEIR